MSIAVFALDSTLKSCQYQVMPGLKSSTAEVASAFSASQLHNSLWRLEMPNLLETPTHCSEVQKSISEEMLRIIQRTLESYWMERGIQKDKAQVAAAKAIVKLQMATTKETWCLLPE
jgi:hypothetical protein